MSNTNTVVMSVTGLPSNVRALSCELQLGINQIPVAYVSIDPTTSDIVTNMEAYRRKACTINVAVGGKTLAFQCYLDGLSTNMSMGALSYTAVFKGQFQTWLEVFPHAPGIHPAGINPLIRQEWIKTGDAGSPLCALQDNINQIFDKSTSTLVDLVIYTISSIIKANVSQISQIKADPTIADGLLSNVLTQMSQGANNPGYRKALQAAESLISKIDTSAVAGLQVDKGQLNILSFITNLFLDASNNNDLWSMLVHSMGVLGCVVVAGFDKLYILPECYFLKPKSHTIPNYKAYSHTPNFAAPSQYNSLSINDNGYKDVSAVAISVSRVYNQDGLAYNTEPANGAQALYGSAVNTTFYGSFPDITQQATSTGGLVVLPADTIASLYAAFPVSTSQNVTSNTGYHKKYTGNEGVADVKAEVDTFSIADNVRAMLNNLAQAKFLGLKYGDRTGSLNLLFSTSWVPGTTGTVFSRRPDPAGVFTDFYVTQVRHVFSAGSALTQVSFSGARTGTVPVGISEFKLYGYTTDVMTSVQNKFIADISS